GSTMGQRSSKHDMADPEVLPNGRFSLSEDVLPRYAFERRPRGTVTFDSHMPASSGTTDTELPDTERRDSRIDGRRSSIYSTMDPVPQLDFYAHSSMTGRQQRSRPSLDILRKSFDVCIWSCSPAEMSYTSTSVKFLCVSLCFLCVFQDGESSTQKDESGIVQQDTSFSEGEKPFVPVRFGWVTGVMVRCMLNIWGVILFLRLSWITSQAGIILTWLIILMSVIVTSVTALSVSAISTNGRVVSGGAYFMISRTLGPEMGGPIGVVFSFANALACALNTVGFAEVVRDMLVEYDALMIDEVNDVRIIGVVTICLLLLISMAGMEWEAKWLFFIVLMVSFANYFVGTVIPVPEKEAMGFFSYHSEIFMSNLLPDWRGPDGSFFQMFAIFFPSAIGILSGVNICGDLKDPSSAIPKGTLAAIFGTTISYLAISATAASCVVRDASGNPNDSLSANFSEPCNGLGCKLGWNFTECEETKSCAFGLANSFKILSLASGFGGLITAGVFAASLSSALAFLVSAPKVFQCLCRDNIYPYIGFFAKGYGKNDEPLRAYLLTFFIAVAFILIAELNIIAALISNFFLCSYALINFSWKVSPKYWSVVYLCIAFIECKINWGSSVQAGTYNMALSYSVSLAGVEDHVKNFRPQCLVLTGPPNVRPALVDFVGSFTKNISLMICGDILMVSGDILVKWLNRRKVRSFYTPFTGDCLREGAKHLLQASGLGKLKPNTLIMGFKNNWKECTPHSMEDYVNTIYRSYKMYQVFHKMWKVRDDRCIDSNLSPLLFSCGFAVDLPSGAVLNDQIKTVFQSKQGKKTIDVYWISDDGGLTLLVPYLLSRRKRWRQSKVRVFIVGEEHTIEEDRKEMILLLQKFRLDIHDVIIMTDSEKPPQAKNLKRFEDTVALFRLRDEQQAESVVQQLRKDYPWKISDKELEALRQKSERKVRLNEIIRRNSQQAALVLVSLPVPQLDCPSALYMAWLDTLTCGLPCPTALIRGNQQNVLTFYCQ
uniref:Uncharacterized protein n=1 Tax=Esox lucius TaxID=8010 RepID=A0A6Q2YQ60_ESOLU